MPVNIDTLKHVFPTVNPTEEDLRAWVSMPRDEQLRLLRAALTHPDCSTVTGVTMSDILAEARGRAATRSSG